MNISFCKTCGARYSTSTGKQAHKRAHPDHEGWKVVKVPDPPTSISYQPGYGPKS